MENQEEKGYEVVDKRANREESTAEEQTKGATEEVEEEEEETAIGDVYSLIQWIVMMLSQSAWQWMGLHSNPVTKKVQQDMIQCKMAIDSVVFLTDKIAPHVSEEQRHAYRTLINDLQINFVEKSRIS